MPNKKKSNSNRIQQKNSQDDINYIFKRIEAQYFSEETKPFLLSYKEKLNPLKRAIENFKGNLEIEATQANGAKFAVKTARKLEATLSVLFVLPTSDDKEREKSIEKFWHYARKARYSRRIKTFIIGIVAGLFFLGLPLALIFGTGGVALMGIGIALGVSFGVGLLGGVTSALAKFFLKPNKHEKRGKEVRDELMKLIEDCNFDNIILSVNRRLFPPERPESIQKIIDKYHPKPKDTVLSQEQFDAELDANKSLVPSPSDELN